MKRYALGILCALAAGLAFGAPPEVPTVIKAKPGQLVRVTVKTDKEIGTAKDFADSDAFWGELVGPKGTRQFVFQAPAPEYDAAGKLIPPKRAQYGLTFWNKDELEGSTTTIVIEGAAPNPNPGPGPNPDPGPKPTPVPVPPGKRFVVVIEETGDAVPARGLMMANAELAARMQSGGHKWRVVDKDNRTAAGSTPADLKPYLAEAAGKKLPRLYIVAPDGTVCFVGDSPNGTDAAAKVLELLKANGG